MKILRLFDSLKFVRAMFVAVVAIFAFVSAHAATLPAGYTELEYLQSTGTQWIDTGYILQSNDVTYEWTAEDLSTMTNTSLFGSEQTEDPKYSGILYGSKTSRSLFVGNRSHAVTYSSDSGFHDWVLSLTNDHNATLYKDGTLISNVSFSGDLQKSISIGVFNNHKSISNQYAKMMLKKFVIKDNNIVKVKLVPARRDSDGVLGMYDLADANPSTAFHTNAGTGTFVAGPAVSIKIATTKYNEQQFAPVKTDLSAAVNAVEYVVSNTMSQAQAIDQIATNKQTRPDESCPPFKKCLLVEDEQGVPHWYEIYDPINDFLRPILAAAALSGNQGAPTQTSHSDGSSTIIDTSNIFFNGSGAFRKKYIDNTTSAADRPFGPTTLPRCADDATRTTSTVNAGICYNTGGMFRTLTEGADDDSGEWALVWNGNEGGASLGITPGVVYGIAKCTSVGQHTTEIDGDVQSGSDYWWPKKLTAYSGGGTTLASLIEQYPNSNVETVFNTLPNPVGTDDNPEYPRANYRNCWCKMTAIGVPGSGDTPDQRYANGTIMSVSGGWFFDRAGTSATDCAYDCAYYCALYVRAYAAFRKNVLTVR